MPNDFAQQWAAGAVELLPEQLPTPPAEARKILADATIWINDNEELVVRPSDLVGAVYYEVRGRDVPMQRSIHAVDVPDDQRSVTETPLLRKEVLTSLKASGKVGFMGMLDISADAEDVLEVRVIDNFASSIRTGQRFTSLLRDWATQPEVQELLARPETGRVSVVTGVVQKYVSTKVYRAFNGDFKGSGWAVNVGGKLHVSASDYDLQVIYGLRLETYREAVSVSDVKDMLWKPLPSRQSKDLLGMMHRSISRDLGR